MDWYSLEEAVNILSCQGVTVSKADLIRAAMDGRISLSVFINGSVKAQLAVMRSLEDAEIFFFIDPENPLESIVQNNGASYEAAYRLLTKKSLSKDQELTLSGVGREFFVSFHGIQTTKGIVAPLSYDPLYVEVSGIVSFQCDHDESHNFLARVFGSLHGVIIGCFPPSSLVATSSTGKFYIIENNPESTPSVMYPFPEGSKLGLKFSDLESISACSTQAEKVDANSTKRKAKRRSPKDDPDSYANHIGRLVQAMYTKLGRVPKPAEVKDKIEDLCKDDQEINYLSEGARYIIWGDERGIDSVKGAINDAIKDLKKKIGN